jgi:FkbM family methyltransferase
MLMRRRIAAAIANRTATALWAKAAPFVRLSWSQEGEDLILARLLEDTRTGFYVDVGAHDPFRFSNTAYFYSRGWSGLNIEPDPDGCRVIRRYRRRDRTLNLGIGALPANLTYHRFFEPALNTFDAALAEQRMSRDGYPLRERISVSVRRLDDTLAEALPEGQAIDFLSVDTEGFDDQVLASNDWNRFRPRFVVAELLGDDTAAPADAPVSAVMRQAGYAPVAKAMNSVIFGRPQSD